MKLIFVRHAEKEKEGKDPHLTKRGMKQAKFLAKKLKKMNIDEFYCSDMNRAKQTSEIVSKQIKLKPKIEKSLNEFKSITLMKDKFIWNKKERKHFRDLRTFLKKITKKPNDEKTILIISHGITNRLILSYFLNLDIKKLIPFRQSKTGLNSIYWFEKFKNWRLRTWNNYSHLPKKLK